MKNVNDLIEQIQEDVLTYLDGMDQFFIMNGVKLDFRIDDEICKLIIERFEEYKKTNQSLF